MSKTLKIFIASAVILAAVFAAGYVTAIKTLGPDPAYWIKKEIYDRDLKKREADLSAALEIIDAKDATIAENDVLISQKDKEIDKLKTDDAAISSTIAALDAQNKTLRTNAAAAIAANPAVRALVEDQDAHIAGYKNLVITLRSRISEERNRANLMGEKFVAAAYQRDIWKKQYEDEHALNIVANGLIADNEKRLSSNKFWKYAGWTVAGILGGIEIYQGIRR